jgi:hypothetical protein
MKSLLHVGRQPRRLVVVRFSQTVFVWVAMCMAPIFFANLAVAGRQGWTPPVSNSERKAIVNTLRQEVKALHGLDVRFVITHLKVVNDWAWIQTRPQSPGGKNRYEDIAALLNKSNGAWRIREIPCGEPDNPDCLGDPDYFKRLQRRFPEAPGEIFPEF